MKRICIVGCGAIGSLYAAHLGRVAEVWALVRREGHARALNGLGLQVTGSHDFHVTLKATTDANELPDCDFGIVATKATQVEESMKAVGRKLNRAAILSAQNGLGSEEIIAAYANGFVMRGATFMSGTRHSDTHVQYELYTETWLGPYEPTETPIAKVRELTDLMVAGGLKAKALEDCRPAQWSKLIFNASVNSASALTELPHSPHFAAEKALSDLGHFVHALMDEGKRVAAAAGIELHDDPWAMNKVGAMTNHPPSMLYDIRNHLPTEVDFLSGAIAREGVRIGVEAPLHTAVYRMVKAKEASWTFREENKPSSTAVGGR